MRVRTAVVAGFAIFCAAALLLVPAQPVLADHAYSHRYVIYGRVIDALGEPAMGWVASATISGPTVSGECPLSPAPAPSTTAYGDFFLCYHVHEMTSGTVTVQGNSFSQTYPLDVNLRKTAVRIQLPITWPTKDPTAVANFDSQYTVRGRVWQPAPGSRVESIPVNGVVLSSEPVSVHTIFNTNAERAGSPLTNTYGDYTSTLSLGAPLTGGVVHVVSHGFSVNTNGIPLDTQFMVSDVDVVVPAPPNAFLEWLANYWWAIAIPAAVLVVTFFVLPRIRSRKPSRDVSRIPGIGRAKASQLRKAGAGTIERLAEADAKELAAATGMSPKESKRLIRKAKAFL